MPEGPQMVYIKEQFEVFVGQQVVNAEGDAPGIPFKNFEKQELKEIKTFGKELLFCFKGFALSVHLMLFGKFAINDTLKRKLRLGIRFSTGEINFYSVKCKIINGPLDAVYDWTTDVMNQQFNKQGAVQKLKKLTGQLICDALLDQQILAGVGNKIKNEVLFRNRVHPENLVEHLPERVIEHLVDECVKLSYAYLSWKEEGIEDEKWKIYKKKECPRDHIPVIKEKLGRNKRTCYFCDKCQNLFQ